MIKVLLDQGIPRSTDDLLKTNSIEAIHVSEIGYSKAEDGEIIDYAIQNQMIVVTLDSDFHMLLATTNASSPSVIRLRIERLKAPQCSKILTSIIQDRQEDLQSGVMLTVRSNQIRLRKLPIRPTSSTDQ